MGFSTLPPSIAVVGTYERTLCGWELEGKSDDDGGTRTRVTPIFSHPAHIGPIKCVAAGGRFLVSGGSDEEIRIFNIAKRVEVGSLMRHMGPITCLKFHGSSHLVSGSEDSKLNVWRTRDWTCLAALQGHKAGIIDCDIHPTGRIMLSCARDKTVKLWDLVKADCVFSFSNPLPSVSEQLNWSPSGKHFSLSSQANLSLFDAESSKLLLALKHDKPVLCSAFLSETDVVTGSEDGIVRVWDSRSGVCTREMEKHQQRIRAVSSDRQGRLLSASSDGEIRIFEAGGLAEGPVFVENLRCRVTCACMASTMEEQEEGKGPVSKRREKAEKKRKDEKLKRKEEKDRMRKERKLGETGAGNKAGAVKGSGKQSAGEGTPKMTPKQGSAGGGTPKSVLKQGSAGGGTPKSALKQGSAGGGTPKSALKQGSAGGGTPKSALKKSVGGVTPASFKKKRKER